MRGCGLEEGCSFLKKKNKRLLILPPLDKSRPWPGIKSFLLLFFKKEVLLLFPNRQSINVRQV
jgi:hypothetical protein